MKKNMTKVEGRNYFRCNAFHFSVPLNVNVHEGFVKPATRIVKNEWLPCESESESDAAADEPAAETAIDRSGQCLLVCKALQTSTADVLPVPGVFLPFLSVLDLFSDERKKNGADEKRELAKSFRSGPDERIGRTWQKRISHEEAQLERKWKAETGRKLWAINRQQQSAYRWSLLAALRRRPVHSNFIPRPRLVRKTARTETRIAPGLPNARRKPNSGAVSGFDMSKEEMIVPEKETRKIDSCWSSGFGLCPKEKRKKTCLEIQGTREKIILISASVLFCLWQRWQRWQLWRTARLCYKDHLSVLADKICIVNWKLTLMESLQ